MLEQWRLSLSLYSPRKCCLGHGSGVLVLYGALVITSPQLLPTFQQDGGAAVPAKMPTMLPGK